MGCDIHCYIEYREKGRTRHDGSPARWESFGARINPGRNYHIFANLAGVRSDRPAVIEPRGAPEDMGYSADEDFWLYINYDDAASDDDEHSCTPAQAKRWGGPTRGAYKPYRHTAYSTEAPPQTEIIGVGHEGEPTHVQQPDWHSASWLTSGEWEQAIASEVREFEYAAMLAVLRSFEAQGCEARVVFWFDN